MLLYVGVCSAMSLLLQSFNTWFIFSITTFLALGFATDSRFACSVGTCISVVPCIIKVEMVSFAISSEDCISLPISYMAVRLGETVH